MLTIALPGKWLCLALAVGLSIPAQAGDGFGAHFEFERLADDLGGRQSSIYDIFQDQRGLLWIAGDTDGLLRFDGHEFSSWSEGFVAEQTRPNVSTQLVTPSGQLWVGSWGNGLQYWDRSSERFIPYLANDQEPDALADNRVQHMHIDSSGRIWIGTAAGINLIEPDQPRRLTRFARDDPGHPLYRERIWAIVEHNDAFWLATSGGIYRLSLDLGEWRHYLLDSAAAESFERGAEVRTIALAQGDLWAGSQLGVFRFDAAADRFKPVPFAGDERQPIPRVNVITESREGHIWVGAFDGLYAIERPEDHFQRQGDSFNRIADVDIRALFEDTEGNLWIGSRDQGMIHGRRYQPLFRALADDLPEDFSEQGTRLTSAVLHDRRDRLWLGVPGGILRRAQDGTWRSWEFPSEIGVRRVESLVEAPSGEIWIGTNDGLFRIGADDQLQTETRLFELLEIGARAVLGLHIDPDGTLWMGLWQYGVVRWHPDRGQPRVFLEQLRELRGDLAYHLRRDAAGQLWAATRYSGVFRFNGEAFERVHLPLADQASPPSFYCLIPERPDLLWLCSEDGLIRYDLSQDEYEHFGIEQGLPVERVTGFHLDVGGSAWVLTSQGVARRLPGSERFVSFGASDGLSGQGLQRNAVDQGADGQLVLGTNRGAFRVDPDARPRGLNAPATVLSRLWIDGVERTRSVDLAAPSLSLASDVRDLMIQFAVLDFHDPARNLARHRLRGYETEFSELTRDRTIRYMNLPPGEYLLEVEGWSSRGVPGQNLLTLPIRVAAPWWHSPLAWLAASLLLAALIWMVVQLRLRALRISNETLQQLVDERTRALEQANARLRARSARDFLTGLLNRRGFTERFAALQQLSVRADTVLSVVLFDLDHFKQINDSYGHDLGDELLKSVSTVLSDNLRAQDLAARWGGEEFLLALPETSAEGAAGVCEKLRSRLAATQLRSEHQAPIITATFGVVSRKGSAQPLENWVKAADEALYAGKKAGRDQVRLATDDDL